MSCRDEPSGMATIWKRLQRVNKHASKFQFTMSYHQLSVIFGSKWVPHKLSIVWSRKFRRVVSFPMPWEPTLQDPYKGLVVWTKPESCQVVTTLFRDLHSSELENKVWSIILEDVSETGKRRPLAILPVNMSRYATVGSTSTTVQLVLKPITKKLTSASVSLTLSSILLKEGIATDEDLQSMTSFTSGNNNCNDIATLEDLDDQNVTMNLHTFTGEDSICDLTDQIQKLTSSLSTSQDHSVSKSVHNNHYFNNSVTSEVDVASYFPTAKISVFPICPPKSTHFTERNVDCYSEECSAALENFHIESLDESDINAERETSCLRKLQLNELTDNLSEPDHPNTARSLFNWCKDITKRYPKIEINNFTTSWKNGLAFCAIIHHHAQHMIDFDGLDPGDCKENCKIAFDAGDKMGIPRVIQLSDIHGFSIPDKIAVMTYLHQLRSHFTGSEVKHEKRHFTYPSIESSWKSVTRQVLPSAGMPDSRDCPVEIDQIEIEMTNTLNGEIKNNFPIAETSTANRTLDDGYHQLGFRGGSAVEFFDCPEDIPQNKESLKMENEVSNLIHEELEGLENEQNMLDKEASELEKHLRENMNHLSENTEEDEALMNQWFIFVNKKNALLRRQMQLNILEKQAELENRYKRLNTELQDIAKIEDWCKTTEQTSKEEALLEELVCIVNERDELVHHLDNQEKAIEDDDLIEKDLFQLEPQSKDKCVVQ